MTIDFLIPVIFLLLLIGILLVIWLVAHLARGRRSDVWFGAPGQKTRMNPSASRAIQISTGITLFMAWGWLFAAKHHQLASPFMCLGAVVMLPPFLAALQAETYAAAFPACFPAALLFIVVWFGVGHHSGEASIGPGLLVALAFVLLVCAFIGASLGFAFRRLVLIGKSFAG